MGEGSSAVITGGGLLVLDCWSTLGSEVCSVPGRETE